MKDKSGAGERLAFSALMLVWTLILPIAVLGVGFTNFEILNPIGLLRDLGDLPGALPKVMSRLVMYAYVLAPVILYYVLIRRPKVLGKAESG